MERLLAAFAKAPQANSRQPSSLRKEYWVCGPAERLHERSPDRTYATVRRRKKLCHNWRSRNHLCQRAPTTVPARLYSNEGGQCSSQGPSAIRPDPLHRSPCRKSFPIEKPRHPWRRTHHSDSRRTHSEALRPHPWRYSAEWRWVGRPNMRRSTRIRLGSELQPDIQDKRQPSFEGSLFTAFIFVTSDQNIARSRLGPENSVAHVSEGTPGGAPHSCQEYTEDYREVIGLHESCQGITGSSQEVAWQ